MQLLTEVNGVHHVQNTCGHSWAKEYDGARMFTSLLLNMTSSLLHSFFETSRNLLAGKFKTLSNLKNPPNLYF